MLDLSHTEHARDSAVFAQLLGHVARRHFPDSTGGGGAGVFGRLRPIVREWYDHHLVVRGGVHKAQLLYPAVADRAAEKIRAAVDRASADADRPVRVTLDPNAPVGTTRPVHFRTAETLLYETPANPAKCPINYCVLDSGWEGEFCRVAQAHPRVVAYAKNHALGFEVPYTAAGVARHYVPDYLLRVDDGRGPGDLLNLVVEIKGYRGEDAKAKADAMTARWVPGVNREARFGRWAFAELTDGYEMQDDFAKVVEEKFAEMVDAAATRPPQHEARPEHEARP